MEEINFPLILVLLKKQTRQYSVVMVVQIKSKTCFVKTAQLCYTNKEFIFILLFWKRLKMICHSLLYFEKHTGETRLQKEIFKWRRIRLSVQTFVR
jgi:hypothetical protein